MNSQMPGQNNETFEIGAIVAGTYKILGLIGQGGMGRVFKVEHLILAKILAMKVLQQDQVSAEVWQRFRTEAQAIARVDHLNIIKIYDMSQTAGGLPFYTMDYLQGESLADRLDENGRLSVDDALPIFEQICNGLGYAHDRGIIHRDIKPGNIMILFGTGQVKLVDFGIAKLLSYDTNVHQGLTKPGEVFGSPLYMSPEQSLGQKVDYRTDMYSVGVTMFQALTGKPPLLGKSAIETVALHQSVIPPSMSETAINTSFPPALEAIVANLMSKDPEDRPSSLYDVAEQLKSLKTGKENSVRKSTNLKIAEPTTAIDETLKDEIDKKKQLVIVSIPIAVILIAALAYVAFYFDQKHQGEIAAKNSPPLKTAFTGNGLPRDTSADAIDDKAGLREIGKVGAGLLDKSLSPEIHKISKTESDRVKQFLAKNKKPYSHAITVRGQNFLQFDFPENFSLGTISFQRSGQREFRGLALGKMIIPNGAFIRLDTGLSIANYPELLKFFRPNEIKILCIRDLPKNHPHVGDYICKIRGLEQLDFRKEKEIQNSDLKWIDKVPDFVQLNLAETAITGDALAPLQMWRRIKGLELDSKPQLTNLLKALVAKQKLRSLSVPICDIGESDYELISKLKELMFLNIRENEMTDNQLKKLTNLKALNELDIQRCRGLTPKSLPTLVNFKNLKILTVNDEVFPPAFLQTLKDRRSDMDVRSPY